MAVAVTLGHMGLMMLPECFNEVLIVADNDAADSQAADTMKKTVAVFQGQGRKVYVYRAPKGFKDVNDMLMGGK